MTVPPWRLLLLGYKAANVANFLVSFFLATVLVVQFNETKTLEHFLSIRVSIQNIILFVTFLGLWHGLFWALKLYDPRRLTDIARQIVAMVAATTLGTLGLGIGALAFSVGMITLPFLGVFWGAAIVFGVVFRFALTVILKTTWARDRNRRHILIAGTNRRAVRLARRLEAASGFGYEVVGFVENGWTGNEEFHHTGHTIVCSFKDLPSFLRHNVVDEVMIVLPIKSFYAEISRTIEVCAQQGVVSRIVSDFFTFNLARSKVETVADESMITVYTGNFSGWQTAVKRLLDIVIAGIGIILTAPIFLGSAVLIKATSRGPVFYTQDRIGLNKRRFRMYKFRTMIPGADRMHAEIEHLNEAQGPVFKIKKDPRVTWIGHFLRSTSIDELPQLLNVLRGDMSLVGPRPLPVRDYEGFDQDWHRRRFSVRPGITCLWQVNGRHNIPFEQWMMLDMQYIDQWSLWLDLKVLAKTIPTIFSRTGA